MRTFHLIIHELVCPPSLEVICYFSCGIALLNYDSISSSVETQGRQYFDRKTSQIALFVYIEFKSGNYSDLS